MVTIKIAVRRVHIDRHGYDSIGCYYGIGQKLWNYDEECGPTYGAINGSERANNLAQAKSQIRDRYPAYDIAFTR